MAQGPLCTQDEEACRLWCPPELAGFMEGLASAGLESIPGVLRPEECALVRDPCGLITEVSCDLGLLEVPSFPGFQGHFRI